MKKLIFYSLALIALIVLMSLISSRHLVKSHKQWHIDEKEMIKKEKRNTIKNLKEEKRQALKKLKEKKRAEFKKLTKKRYNIAKQLIVDKLSLNALSAMEGHWEIVYNPRGGGKILINKDSQFYFQDPNDKPEGLFANAKLYYTPKNTAIIVVNAKNQAWIVFDGKKVFNINGSANALTPQFSYIYNIMSSSFDDRFFK